MRLPFLAVRTRSADETASLGSHIGGILRPGEILLLVGDLGTGKTTFVRGLADGLGISTRPRSPTFTVVHTYDGGTYPLVHVDLYRLDSSREVLNLGLEELFEPPAVSVIEWGEKAGPIVGDDYLELDFAWEEPADPGRSTPDANDDVRNIRFLPFGRWQQRMGEISDTVRRWASQAAPTRGTA
jgi:tRNA threonylcarbamoyladenosine biosynthesis protein TsaE